MTNEFNVIGERKDDELHLLVRDDDGQHYDYSVASEQVSPIELDERWEIDGASLDETDPDVPKKGNVPPNPGDAAPFE